MMQIVKIISGGQTGADQAALDAAMELGIDHGGWISKGRLTEDGPLPETYNLEETSTGSDSGSSERNVLDSGGTVVITRGPPSGGSKLTVALAHRHGRPCLHLDLQRVHPLKASSKLYQWILAHGVQVLNVAGSRIAEDRAIYNDVYQVIWGLFVLDTLGAEPGPDARAFRLEELSRKIAQWPETVEAAVEFLERYLSLEQQVGISRMNESALGEVQASIGGWIGETFGLRRGNKKLLQNVEAWAARTVNSADEASFVILNALAQRLRQTHRLRVIK
jgi:hypothetical protein